MPIFYCRVLTNRRFHNTIKLLFLLVIYVLPEKMNMGLIMFKKKIRSKKSLVLLAALVAILLARPALSQRSDRKQSAQGPAPRSPGASYRENSPRPSSPPSNPGMSYRQAPAPGRNIPARQPMAMPQNSNRPNAPVDRYRTYRQNTANINPTNPSAGRRTISNNPVPRAAPDRSDIRSQAQSSRVPRQSSSLPPPYPAPAPGPDRSIRKQSTYDYYPVPHSRYYSYHHDYYPHDRIFYWITWPDYYYPIYYTWGPSYSVGYYWPYYHRKYVFVSLGGYWPDYPYMRYYWYGYHPYTWYGYYPPDYVVSGNTYNYYYNTEPPPDAAGQGAAKRDEKSAAQPVQESQADRNFDEAVKTFESGDYASAANKFYEAQVLAPDDVVLPFAYVQALFADSQYKLAGRVLRGALMKQSTDKEGVFYPRGLYPDENVLQQQIDQFRRTVILNKLDADSHLLLGYQLLGIGKYDEAAQYLQTAAQDSENGEAAKRLLNLLEKLKQANKKDTQEPEKPQSGDMQTNLPDDSQESGVMRTETGAVKLPFDK